MLRGVNALTKGAERRFVCLSRKGSSRPMGRDYFAYIQITDRPRVMV